MLLIFESAIIRATSGNITARLAGSLFCDPERIERGDFHSEAESHRLPRKTRKIATFPRHHSLRLIYA